MIATTNQRRVTHIYPDAYISNTASGKGIDQFYITTPELQKQRKILGEYKAYKAAAWESAAKAINDAYVHLTPFNLTEALAGKPIVTRNGMEVTQFQKRDSIYSIVPYSALINGKQHYYPASGSYIGDEVHRFDLFMK